MYRRNFLKISIAASAFASSTLASTIIDKIDPGLKSKMMFDTKVWVDNQNKVHRMEFPDGTVVTYQRNALPWIKYPDGTVAQFTNTLKYEHSHI